MSSYPRFTYVMDDHGYTDYIMDTADDRTFGDILMTIWDDAEKTPGFNMWGLKEDIQELLRRYGMMLDKFDDEFLLARREDI